MNTNLLVTNINNKNNKRDEESNNDDFEIQVR